MLCSKKICRQAMLLQVLIEGSNCMDEYWILNSVEIFQYPIIWSWNFLRKLLCLSSSSSHHLVVPSARTSLTLSPPLPIVHSSGRSAGLAPPYPHRAAVCRFELVTLLLLSHVKGSLGAHHLWARLYFSSGVLLWNFLHVPVKNLVSFNVHADLLNCQSLWLALLWLVSKNK